MPARASRAGNGGKTPFGHRHASDQHLVHRHRQAALVHARAHGGVALRVQIDHQHALANFGQTSGQIHRGGGFTNATFLVGNTKYFGHAAPDSSRVKKAHCKTARPPSASLPLRLAAARQCSARRPSPARSTVPRGTPAPQPPARRFRRPGAWPSSPATPRPHPALRATTW